MSTLWQFFAISAPWFAIVLAGYVVASFRRWRRAWTAAASKLVFTLLLPVMLFHLMSDLASLPAVDSRLLIAFFGGCFLVFALGRLVAARAFRLNGAEQSVFALGGVFSNNVLLGLPLAKLTLGDAALPSVALILTFNALFLWTLVTVSVEWSRHGSLTPRGFGQTAFKVVTNPIVAAILLGSVFSYTGLRLPEAARTAMSVVGGTAAPAALLVLGMGLVEYGVRKHLRCSGAISAIKLVAQPLVVWILALALGLPALERTVAVLLASMSVGANVYLMAVEFEALEGAVAGSLVLSTAAAAVTTPIVLTLIH